MYICPMRLYICEPASEKADGGTYTAVSKVPLSISPNDYLLSVEVASSMAKMSRNCWKIQKDVDSPAGDLPILVPAS